MSGETATQAAPRDRPVSTSRRRAVERAVDDWVRQLIDLTGRNQLLYYRTLKRGTIDLQRADPSALDKLISGSTVALSALFPNTDSDPDRLTDALRRARVIHAKAREHFEERGISTLFLTLGMARWATSSTSSVPCAPVLLRPLTMKPRGASAPNFDLTLDGEWSVNSTLLHLLQTEFDARIDGAKLEAALESSQAGFSPEQVFRRLKEHSSGVPEFDIVNRSVIGTFGYTKLPMVRDLQESIEALAAHDLVAAIAGDAEARDSVRHYREADAKALHPDWVPPADEFLILDTDSSQNFAINSALAGRQIVIQGPPGTGKSQTIANLIASLAARGRRVLFVAEKRAAIEAVTKRLDLKGLGHLVMDLHGGAGSRRQIAERIGESLASMKEAAEVDVSRIHPELEAARSILVRHEEALHTPREPWGMSLFEVYGKLAELPGDLPPSIRLPKETLGSLNEAAVDEAGRELGQWASLARRILDGSSPWKDASISSSREADSAFACVVDLADNKGPELSRELTSIVEQTGIESPLAFEDWAEVLQLLEELAGLLRNARPAVFDLPLHTLASRLTPDAGSIWSRFTATISDGEYRKARRSVRGVLEDPKRIHPGELLSLVQRATELKGRWDRLGGRGVPTVPVVARRARSLFDPCLAAIQGLAPSRLRSALLKAPHVELVDHARTLVEDEAQLRLMPEIARLENSLSNQGLSSVLEQARDRSVPGTSLAALLRKSWLSGIEREIRLQDPLVSGFDGSYQSDALRRFRQSDLTHLESTSMRVRRAVAENAARARNQYKAQDTVVSAEAKRKRGHLSLRDLFKQAPDVLTALRPCWAMSPLVVAQLLPASQVFDVVIFDEASQVRPADAVPALLRASQAVIAGDEKQLPPTSSFVGRNDEEDVEEELEAELEASDDTIEAPPGLTRGFESILDVLDPILGDSDTQHLTWHYRSRDDRLISFANYNTYMGKLTTFPGTQLEPPIRHVLLPHVPGLAVDTRSSDAEVQKVIELALEHARERPDESLGIIAMGQFHATRIEAALHRRLGESREPKLSEFFDEARSERTFVKNIERVQGDERDAIILSIGYSKTSAGQLRYHFGSLNEDGGERRLNVAVTRQRNRLTVVSSFSHLDMDPGRSTRRGVVLLRSFLKFAESGGIELENANAVHPLNPFEVSIYERLQDAGISCLPQYGTSGYRIDFAVPHPSGDGRMLLAIEADGAMYHSAESARDRDRLRQQVLESQGWVVHRIWSTNWFNDSEGEVAKVKRAYELALHSSRTTKAAGAAPPAGASSAPRPPGAASSSPSALPSRTGRRPTIRKGQAINEYRFEDLIALFRWIASDGIIRTHEEQVEEAIRELGYQRRGPRIVSTLQWALKDAGT